MSNVWKRYLFANPVTNVDPTCCHFVNLLGSIFCSFWVIAKVGIPLKAKSGNVKNFILPLLEIYEMQLQSCDNKITVKVTKLPKLALLSPNLAGPFLSNLAIIRIPHYCQHWNYVGPELLQKNRATYFPWQAKESIHSFVVESVSASFISQAYDTVIPKLEGIG